VVLAGCGVLTTLPAAPAQAEAVVRRQRRFARRLQGGDTRVEILLGPGDVACLMPGLAKAAAQAGLLKRLAGVRQGTPKEVTRLVRRQPLHGDPGGGGPR